jgi:CubicO group peptidase (beta-lactamase class C family)
MIEQIMTREAFPHTTQVLQAGVAEGVAPGMVAGVWERKNPHDIWLKAYGKRRLVPSAQDVKTNTVFDLASLTKVIATAPLVAVLVARRWLDWDTSVRAVLPEYIYPEVRIRHLLSHTAGYEAWQPLWEKMRDAYAPKLLTSVSVSDRQEMTKKWVMSARPVARPGAQALYSDLSFILLGFVLEQVLQTSLSKAVKKYVWDPMGIESAFFKEVKESSQLAIMSDVAATEDSVWRGGVLQGQVHDDNCWAMGGYGTARDLLIFSRSLLFKSFFPHQILNEMWAPVQEPLDCTRTLGWDTPSVTGSSVGNLFSKHSVGHLGYTGTSLWIDRDAERAVVLLTNRVHPTRDNTQIKEFRPRFHEAICKDLN